MKNKNQTAILALFLGLFGTHRFHLGQRALGFLHFGFFLAGFILMLVIPNHIPIKTSFLSFFFGLPIIVSFIDAILFLSMDKEDFDAKYNNKGISETHLEETENIENRKKIQQDRDNFIKQQRQIRVQQKNQKVTTIVNPFEKSGLQKFKDYDFDGAIEDFEKALSVRENDPNIHFKLACAYATTEQADEAFYHLDRSVALGFKDFEQIKTADELSFLRLQDEFENFQNNNFRLSQKILKKEKNLTESSNLLEQLQKLAELRERGLLTEQEYTHRKHILLQ